MRAASKAAALLAALVASAGLLGGVDLAVGALLGAVAILGLALTAAPWWELALFAVAVACCVAGALVVSGPIASAAWVALSVAVTAPSAMRHGAVTAVVPVLVAVAATGTQELSPAFACAGTAAAAGLFALILRLLGLGPLQSQRIPWHAMVWHLVVMGAATATATAAVIGLGLVHGVWVVVAIATVLVPMRDATIRAGRVRVAGTVMGAAVGTVLATVLPPWAALAIALVALLWGLASALVARRTEFVAYVAISIVCATAVLGGEAAAGVAVQRVGYTLAGAGIAILLGLVTAARDDAAPAS
ncbi:hypothetical protein Dac01nite_22060 [Demequina activiva]|uniref:Integral membrane bound transporter domain-containing protein n=1 Tax=Demequina activiva TaxID=1582364 RepID=A0A919Q4K6_9MICO|nr:hypothetical protein Dac01nite_22060 [Demequina activiva]